MAYLYVFVAELGGLAEHRVAVVAEPALEIACGKRYYRFHLAHILSDESMKYSIAGASGILSSM